jgi:hypothetical protein
LGRQELPVDVLQTMEIIPKMQVRFKEVSLARGSEITFYIIEIKHLQKRKYFKIIRIRKNPTYKTY